MKARAKALVFKPSPPALPTLLLLVLLTSPHQVLQELHQVPQQGSSSVTPGRSYRNKPSSSLGLSLNLNLNLQKAQEASRVKIHHS